MTDNSDRGVTSTTHGNDDNANTNKHSCKRIRTWHRAGSVKGGRAGRSKNSYRTIMENRKKIHRTTFLLTKEKTDAEKHKWRYKNIANRTCKQNILLFAWPSLRSVCILFVRCLRWRMQVFR